MATKLGCVRVDDDLVHTGCVDPDPVVNKRLGRVEVEDPEQPGPFEDDHLVTLVLARDVTLGRVEPAKPVLDVLHARVEPGQLAIPEQVVVDEVELAAGVVERVAVALAREVKPLRVAELVAFEVEITLTAETVGDEPDELVKGHTTVNHRRELGQLRHVGVHLSVAEPEHERLVTDERLVVALCVCNRLLHVPAVGEGVDKVTYVPIRVVELLEPLDVQVRNGHGKTIVKSKSAERDRNAQAGHSRNVLGDRDCRWEDPVNHLIRHHQINNRLEINGSTKVLVVTARETGSDTVMSVHHASDTVEPEAVELILLHPEPKVAEQETHNLVVAVVEETRVPELMGAHSSIMEIVVGRAIKLVQTVKNVFGSVRVNNVQQDRDSHPVGSIDEFLEIVGGSIPRRRGEEVVDLVAKAGIVRMLHNRHQLDDIVSHLVDTGKGVLSKLLVRRNLWLRR